MRGLGLTDDNSDVPMPIKPGLQGSEQPKNAAPDTPDDDALYENIAPAPPRPENPFTGPCDRRLDAFWSPGEHVIGGKQFWLSGVFTIDIDSDGRVDDVGFKIKTSGQVGNILNYFPGAEGQLSGQNLVSLRLDADHDIYRLCPGNITFERPEPVAGTGMPKQESPRADEQETPVQQEEKPEEPQPESEPKQTADDIPMLMYVIGGFGLIFMLAGCIGLGLALRKLLYPPDEEEEDLNDDENEE